MHQSGIEMKRGGNATDENTGALFSFSAAFITSVVNGAMFSVAGKRIRVSILRAELLSALCSKRYENIAKISSGFKGGVKGVTNLKLEAQDWRELPDAEAFGDLLPSV
jgi:hypothetical protein